MVVTSNEKRAKSVFRRLKLYSDVEDIPEDYKKCSLLKPCVSFDTVPSYAGTSSLETEGAEFAGVQIPQEYSMEEYYDDESGYATEDNKGYFSNNNYLGDSSSSIKKRRSSPPRRSKLTPSLSSFKIAEGGKIVRTDYPSRPSVISDAVIISRTQYNWRSKWKNRKKLIREGLENEEKIFQFQDVFEQETKTVPKMMTDGYVPLTKEQKKRDNILHKKVGFTNTPRTIVCPISGRRHTWVALDYMLKNVVQDTDHIVVVANLPRLLGNVDKFHRFKQDHESHTNSISRSTTRRSSGDGRAPESFVSSGKTDPASTKWCDGYDKNGIEIEVRNIFQYIRMIVSPNIALKITVDIVVAKTSKMLCDIINVYTPDFVMSSTLKWNPTDNIVVWKSKKVTDKLCTIYPIPVVIVPVQRMDDFEADLQNNFSFKNVKNKQIVADNIIAKDAGRKPVNEAITSRIKNEVTSRSDLEKLEQIAKITRQVMEDQLSRSRPQDGKLHKLDIICHSSIQFAREVASIKSANSDPEFEELRKVLTGGEVRPTAQSRRSMLDFASKPRHHHHHHHHSSNSSNNSSKIKFASNVKSKDGKVALGNSRTLNPPSLDRQLSSGSGSSNSSLSYPLTRVKSDTNSATNSSKLGRRKKDSDEISIRKIKSANTVEPVKSNTSDSSSGKAKKTGFFSMFKKG